MLSVTVFWRVPSFIFFQGKNVFYSKEGPKVQSRGAIKKGPTQLDQGIDL